MPLSGLSVEGGRFYDIIKGKCLAFNGGRSNLDSASLHRLKTIYVVSLHRLKSIYVLSLHRLKTIYVVSPEWHKTSKSEGTVQTQNLSVVPNTGQPSFSVQGEWGSQDASFPPKSCSVVAMNLILYRIMFQCWWWTKFSENANWQGNENESADIANFSSSRIMFRNHIEFSSGGMIALLMAHPRRWFFHLKLSDRTN